MSLLAFDRIDESFVKFYPKDRGPLALSTLRMAQGKSQATVILCCIETMKELLPVILGACGRDVAEMPTWPRFGGADIGVCDNVPYRMILFLNQRDPRNPEGGNVLLEVAE